GDSQFRSEPRQGAEGRASPERRSVDRAREPLLPPGPGAAVSGSGVATALPVESIPLDAWGDLTRARAALGRGARRIPLEGLCGPAASLALAGLLPPGRPTVVVVADEPTAYRALDDLRAFASALGLKPPGEVVLMPVPHAALWRDAGAREEDASRAG